MNQKLIQKKHPPGNELQLQLLISGETIHKRLEKVARDLEIKYRSEEVCIVMVLKGSFILVADLMRSLHLPIRIETVQVLNGGEHRTFKGEQEVSLGDHIDIEGRHLLLVDTIFDTGETMAWMYQKIQGKNPASLTSLVLLSKDVPRHTDFRPDISLFDIEDRFVVGYGLDYKEYYRGLPDIYSIEI